MFSMVTGANELEFKADSEANSEAEAELAAESPENLFRSVTCGRPDRATLLAISNVPAPTCRVQEKNVFKIPV